MPHQLDAFGVERSLIRTARAGTRTSLALSETRLDDHETLIYRNDAADFDLDPAVLEDLDPKQFDAIVLTGTALARAPSRDVVLGLLDQADAANVPVVLDLDYRPYSWASMDEASTVYLKVARRSRTVVGNDEEFAVLWNATAPDPDHARRLVREGVALCVYKMGSEGAITFEGRREVRTGIFPRRRLEAGGCGGCLHGRVPRRPASEDRAGAELDPRFGGGRSGRHAAVLRLGHADGR